MKSIYILILLCLPFSAYGECPIEKFPNERDLNKVKEMRMAQEELFKESGEFEVVNCLYRLAKTEAEIALYKKDYDSAVYASEILMGLDPSDSWGTIFFILASQGKGNKSNEILEEYIRDMSMSTTEDRFLKYLANSLVDVK